MSDWEGVRLHVVTGKGGVGKTTVSAALALALAANGHKVLLAEVEGRQGLAHLFDVGPLDYTERRIASAPGGGEVYGLAIDAREAMHEYLTLFYKLGRAARALDRVGFVEFATTIAPGLRDVLLTGKTYESTRRQTSGGAYVYDAVILDAPPTGRVTRFLDVNASVSSLARVGPVHRQATSITKLLHSPRTAVHVVTLLEDMPVQEAVDTVTELGETEIPVGAVIVNQVRKPHLNGEERILAKQRELDREAIVAGLQAAAVPHTPATLDRLAAEAADHAARLDLEDDARVDLSTLERPMYDLPHLPDGIDPTAVYELAEILQEQGAA
ncbi:ArsA family ATPase [Phytoactinopolyspora mesophila]|uniref:AAA family ATPase n=1 Tax=Phytoactinopolyspora mesophila TaxID=2650750 RepID=A0A7K3MAT9_9ACTN|nr:ArsA-related P-loop ATPase [Phytoactinopolyspora mesophila]NDL60425.1 AAA family ATPase [Phytoactinopolyspora mesophila]